MKFYKMSLTLMLSILLIASGLVIMGVQYAFKSSELDNNIFYSEMSSKMISEYLDYQIQNYKENLFHDEVFLSLRNDYLYKKDSSDHVSKDAEETKFSELCKKYGFEYYYIENQSGAPKTNGSYELIQSVLVQDEDRFYTQYFIQKWNDQLYFGVLKNMFDTDFYNDSKSYLALAPVEKMFDIQILNSFMNMNNIIYTAGNEYTIPSTAQFLENRNYIDISDSTYNKLYLTLDVDSENSILLTVEMDKPEIIKNLRRQTYFIVGVVFFILIITSVIASFVLRRISKQITKTVGIIDNISNGHYEIDLDLDGILELKQLSYSVNKMSKTINDKITELNLKNEETLSLLIETLNETDSYTKGHSDRVCQGVKKLGEALDYKEMDVLIKAALLHDIGKITIPEQILNKKGPLTDSEFKVIQEHSYTGYKILHKSTSFNNIELLVLHHHEKYDGTGYPMRLAGEEIPLGAQILSIVDVYDALISSRPYRKAMSHYEAIHLISSSMKSQFSNVVLDAFLKHQHDLHKIIILEEQESLERKSEALERIS